MKKILFTLLISLSAMHPGISQEPDMKELFLAAESYFLFEEFNEALPLYLRIHRQMPENHNVNFKIGVCYLNDPFQKDKSIAYLESASKSINPKYKENNFKELAAPPEVLFYLGHAYRVNNQLDKAREVYQRFKEQVDPEVYDIQLVDEQILACDNAEKLMKKPIDFDIENLGNVINTRFTDKNPVISGDESKMAYVSRLQFYDAVFFTEKVDGQWTQPRNIIPELGVDGDVYPTSLSYDGTEMIIYRSDEFIGNLYSSRLVNGKWTGLKKLNENINTRFWESHGSLSKDGKTLYFSSNRREGFGGLDIYRSERQPNGEWGIPVNLGPAVNTKYNDDTPFITPSGEKLFFSSYGHFNMGGYDIFMAKKNADGSWAQPINIGYPINTADDEQFLVPLQDGQIALHSRYDVQDGFGRHDIFRYRIYTADHPRIYPIEGMIGFLGTPSDISGITISVVENTSRDSVVQTAPEADRSFRFGVPAGKYDMIFDSEKFQQKIVPLEITPNTPHEGLVLKDPITLELRPVPLPVEEMERLLTIREDSIIYAREGEEVKIRYNAEKDSEVVIDVYHEGSLISSDTTIADKRRNTFEFMPKPGENEVHITVTDQDGNTITRKIKVIVPESNPKLDTEMDATILPEGKGTIAESAGTSGEDATSLEKLIQNIRDKAAPELKKYLDSLDPAAMRITTEKELIDHLYDATATEKFTRDQVTEALLSAGLINEVDSLIRDLSAVASPALQKYLLDLDPEKEGIMNQDDLIRHLYDHAGPDTYPAGDVTDALDKLYNLKEIKRLIEELKPYADGALLDYLDSLDPALHSIYSLEDLQIHLLENAEENGFTKEEVIQMFLDYFDGKQGNMKEILERMMKSSDGITRDYLESIYNSWDESLKERKAFYDHLFNNAGKKGVNIEDLLGLAIDAEDLNILNLADHLLKYGSPQLQEAVKSAPDTVRTAREMYEHLLSNKKVDTDETNEQSRDYLDNKELYDLYYSMVRNSEGALQDYLKSLDIRNSGFNSPQDLIEHLLNVAPEKGFTSDEVFAALGKAYNEAYIHQVISDLIRLADDPLKKALLDLDPSKEGVRTLGDIIDYLLKNKDVYGYSEKDVYDLIRKYLAGETGLTTLDEESSEVSPGMKESFRRGVRLTAGILLLEGLIILILIILARRKKKKDAGRKDTES